MPAGQEWFSMTGYSYDSRSDSLNAYLKDISGITPLTRAEEIELARDGGDASVRKLVERNLKYVVMVANHYKGMGMSMNDLINEGNIGMMVAARRFNPDKGVKFITYAVWWVRQAILRALAEQARIVRLPVKQAGLINRITRAVEALSHRLKREPKLDEVAGEMRIRPKSLETIMRVYKDYMSLDSPISDDDSVSLGDLLGTSPESSVEEEFIRLCFHHDMEKLLAELPEREAEVLRMRYGFDDPPMTLEGVGGKLGLTRERIRQIEKSAKEKLRVKTRIRILEEYLR
ncbi:MAG: RNA polymerase sigma factor RpoD/SigA [Nitrospinae bacterium]|nr:RNA polymerase sigma factor RpoD/SigA [Nitrospinota bacterium]